MNRGLLLFLLLLLGCENLAPEETPPPPPDPGFVLARPFPDIRALNDVFVVARDEEHITNAYAVGTAGAILRYDGTRWSDESAAIEEDVESVSVFAADFDGDGQVEETALAVGEGGVILQRVGGRWGLLPSPVTSYLFAVWVRAPDDAWIVGDAGTVLRFDGTTVTPLTAELFIDTGTVDENGAPIRFPISEPLKGVEGTGAEDVWVVGARGAVYRWQGPGVNGGRFQRDNSGTNRPLADIFLRGDFWAASTDGVLLRRTGDFGSVCSVDGDACWSDSDRCTPAPVFLQGVWGRGGNDLFAVGLAEELFHNEDGLWNVTFVEEQAELRAIDGAELVFPEDPPEDFVLGREIIAVGAGGRIVRGPAVLPGPGEKLLDTREAEIDPEAPECF